MRLFRKEKSELDDAIEKLLEEMRQHDHETTEYKTALEQLGTLYKLKNDNSRSVTPDMMLMVAGGIVQVVIIVAYEQKHVFATAAKNFISTLKLK